MDCKAVTQSRLELGSTLSNTLQHTDLEYQRAGMVNDDEDHNIPERIILKVPMQSQWQDGRSTVKSAEHGSECLNIKSGLAQAVT